MVFSHFLRLLLNQQSEYMLEILGKIEKHFQEQHNHKDQLGKSEFVLEHSQ
jgi:hypothetical protein